jgi:hypothetical protein
MSTEHYKAKVQGFYSGSVDENWPAVDEDGYSNAKNQIFNELCTDPDASYVDVDGLTRDFKRPGLKFRYTGNYTFVQTAEQHSHHDLNAQGKATNFQGRRYYQFDFEISIRERKVV